MENASKALIIAGAILLSILIISLGILVYNNAKNTVGSANLNKQEIQTFNSQWESYIGDNKTASEVRSMIQAAVASNAAEKKSGQNRTVTVNDATPNTNVTLSNAKTYNITVDYNDDGLVEDLNYSETTVQTQTQTPAPHPGG